jgi:hypothetical protein
MLNKIEDLKCEEIQILTSFVNVDIENFLTRGFVLENDKLKYKDLLCDSLLSENKNNTFVVSDVIDKLMFENYPVYNMMKNILNDYQEHIAQGKAYIEKYIELYEKLMLESKFDFSDTRAIQKQILLSEIDKYIQTEEYEKCIELKSKIEEI